MPNNPLMRKSSPVSEEGEYIAASFNAPRGITASAALVDLKNHKEVEAIEKRRKADTWQSEAWEYYDLIGEVKASASLVANVLSRISLYPAYVTSKSTIPSRVDGIEDLDEMFKQDADNLIRVLESGNGGTAGLLRDAALNLFIAGECWLVREPAKYSTGEAEKWQIRSVEEIISEGTSDSAKTYIKPRRDAKKGDYIPLPQGGTITRIWRSHPRFSDEADSSVRGVMDECDELLLISKMTRATAKSRLNAGMLFIPDGLTNMTQNDSDDTDMADDGADSFEEDLIDALITPIADETSASAIVPLVLRGPDEMGEKIKFIKFERSIDQQAIMRSQNLLDRILAGLDIPLDVAKGLSGVKYSNAILIEEQLYKAHIEPLILMIVDCLTVGFLRPALRALHKYPDDMINRAVIWYDPSAITAKPSKAEAATAGHTMGILSDSAWRRYHGFAETDQPSEMEKAVRFAKERGTLSEVLTDQLIKSELPEDILEQSRTTALSESDPASANALGEALNPNGMPLQPFETPAEQANPVTRPPSDLL